MANQIHPKWCVGFPSEWNTGLCDCFDDTNVCLYGLFCPCFLFGDNVKRTHSTTTLLCPCFLYAVNMMFFFNCWYLHKDHRCRFRVVHGLPSGCGDCPTAAFCGPCALCQEARELNIREKEETHTVQQQPR